jgi:uncharacterized protein YhbP (UPF0306 family)
MTIVRSRRPIAAERLSEIARSLLDASTLCAIATVSTRTVAHVNTAYFAWSPELDLIWLSDPAAAHSRNLLHRSTAAVAVYDSHQSWGGADRGVQLFGSARELPERAGADAEAIYSTRFGGFDRAAVSAYRFFRFRPGRVKLFDEQRLGPGVFVTAKVGRGGVLTWARTDVYRPGPDR